MEPTHRALAALLYSFISNLNPSSPLISGALEPNKVRLMPGGLANIPESFPLLGVGFVTERKEVGNVKRLSAEKLVYRLEQ